MNVHKTFRWRPGRILNALCTFDFRPVSTSYCKVIAKKSAFLWSVGEYLQTHLQTTSLQTHHCFSTLKRRVTKWNTRGVFVWISTFWYVTMECIELNWLCKHVKKIRRSQGSVLINFWTGVKFALVNIVKYT